jgi:hypothetical protein
MKLDENPTIGFSVRTEGQNELLWCAVAKAPKNNVFNDVEHFTFSATARMYV